MAYLPTADAVLFPRPPEDRTAAEHRATLAQGDSHQADRRVLRQAIASAFSDQELEILCSDLRGDLVRAGYPPKGAELVPGPMEYQVMKLIESLERYSALAFLERAVHRERPALKW
jgi:hypothetical protein